MIWELYEVWSVDDTSLTDLVDTTKSLKEARQIAQLALTDSIVECIIYKEDENGEPVEIERVK